MAALLSGLVALLASNASVGLSWLPAEQTVLGARQLAPAFCNCKRLAAGKQRPPAASPKRGLLSRRITAAVLHLWVLRVVSQVQLCVKEGAAGGDVYCHVSRRCEGVHNLWSAARTALHSKASPIRSRVRWGCDMQWWQVKFKSNAFGDTVLRASALHAQQRHMPHSPAWACWC